MNSAQSFDISSVIAAIRGGLVIAVSNGQRLHPTTDANFLVNGIQRGTIGILPSGGGGFAAPPSSAHSGYGGGGAAYPPSSAHPSYGGGGAAYPPSSAHPSYGGGGAAYPPSSAHPGYGGGGFAAPSSSAHPGGGGFAAPPGSAHPGYGGGAAHPPSYYNRAGSAPLPSHGAGASAHASFAVRASSAPPASYQAARLPYCNKGYYGMFCTDNTEEHRHSHDHKDHKPVCKHSRREGGCNKIGDEEHKKIYHHPNPKSHSSSEEGKEDEGKKDGSA